MIFIDTNIFLRFLLKDNDAQYLEAKELFLQASYGHIKLITSLIVFFEVAWVLESVYGKRRDLVHEILFKILNLAIELEERELLIESLGYFGDSSLSLSDCFNLAFAKSKKAESFKTFDIKLAKKFKQIS